jgi:hypothetical protein
MAMASDSALRLFLPEAGSECRAPCAVKFGVSIFITCFFVYPNDVAEYQNDAADSDDPRKSANRWGLHCNGGASRVNVNATKRKEVVDGSGTGSTLNVPSVFNDAFTFPVLWVWVRKF